MRVCSLMGAVVLCLASGAATALSGPEILALHEKAMGGEAAISALQSVKLSGKLIITNANVTLATTEVRARPLLLRSEASIQGLTGVQAYDGQQAWKIEPWQGRKDPERMSDDDAKELIDQADMDGPLLHPAAGDRISYAGLEDVDGDAAHKFVVSHANGDVATVYLDPSAYLIIRIRTRRNVRGAEVVSETDYGSYTQVAGVWMPFSSEQGTPGAPKTVKQIIEKAEANIAPTASSFAFPGVAATTIH